ncbi:MAG TPA: hypothetical protein VF157_06550 [Chloroflexota bacterium]
MSPSGEDGTSKALFSAGDQSEMPGYRGQLHQPPNAKLLAKPVERALVHPVGHRRAVQQDAVGPRHPPTMALRNPLEYRLLRRKL